MLKGIWQLSQLEKTVSKIPSVSLNNSDGSLLSVWSSIPSWKSTRFSLLMLLPTVVSTVEIELVRYVPLP